MKKFIGIAGAVLSALFAVLVGQAGALVDGPEIDPGMASSAIALLACGWLILASRRWRK